MAELDCGNVNNGANGDAIPEISKCEENASDTSLNVTDRESEGCAFLNPSSSGVSESEVQNTDEVTAAYASSDEADECVISVSEDLNIVKDVDEDASENESDEYEADEERRRSHRRSSEGASNVSEEVGEDEDDGEEDGDGGDSERSQGSDAGNDEADVKEEGNDEDNKEDETNDEAWMCEKRHSGDGEEQVPAQVAEKELDIDDDRQNPAYIPRKGLFYQHDMRIDETADTKMEQPKKKLWIDDRKWLHDRYDEHAQTPKTRQELITEYGYDIRASDRPDGDGMTRRHGRARAARGSRGTRQLKDFLITDHANQRRSSGDHLSDDHEAVTSDKSDDENAVYHQTASRTAGGGGPRRGRGRRSGPARGRYSEMRQQYGDSFGDPADRPHYSGARGRGFRNDNASQQKGYSSQVYERRDMDVEPRSERNRGPGRQPTRYSQNYDERPDADAERRPETSHVPARQSVRYSHNYDERRDIDVENRPEMNRGPGKQPTRYSHRYDDRQPVVIKSGQSQEDWGREVTTGHYNKPTEQRKEHLHTTTSQPADNKMSQPRPSYSDHRVSDTVRPQRQEEKPVSREPARRIHPTRTISNSQYYATDNIHKDRSSQIGGIVDAMNRMSVKTAAGDRHTVSSTQQNVAPKSAVIVSGSAVPEIIPPVTQTQSRTVPPAVAASTRLHEQDAKGGDAVPRMTVTHSNAAAAVQHMSKPKRYSTQRQRLAAEADATGDVPLDIPNAGMPAAQKPSAVEPTYYDDENRSAKPLQYLPPPPPHMVPMSSIPYRLQALPPEAYYQTSHGPQPTAASPPSLVHAARYLGPPSQMMPPPPPGSYYVPPPPPPPQPQSYGYPSPSLVQARPYCLPAPQLRQYIPPSPTPQMITEQSPSMEVRSGTVYFNAETQQPELRVGGIYYGPAGQQPTSAVLPVRRPNSAIPIVNPQEAEPPPMYYSEYPYALAGNDMSYDAVMAATSENMHVDSGVA